MGYCTLSLDEFNSALLKSKFPKWLERLDLIDSYRLNPLSDSETAYEFLVRKYKGGPRSPTHRCRFWCFPSPTGAGALLLRSRRKHSLFLNNPKHISIRKVQSELADLLIEVVKESTGYRLSLESHSEHLLIRLMRRIAEEQISADDTAFYFCEMNEGCI